MRLESTSETSCRLVRNMYLGNGQYAAVGVRCHCRVRSGNYAAQSRSHIKRTYRLFSYGRELDIAKSYSDCVIRQNENLQKLLNSTKSFHYAVSNALDSTCVILTLSEAIRHYMQVHPASGICKEVAKNKVTNTLKLRTSILSHLRAQSVIRAKILCFCSSRHSGRPFQQTSMGYKETRCSEMLNKVIFETINSLSESQGYSVAD